MIVVTVGTQLPFDRLIEAVDALAPKLATELFAQTGKGAYRPENMRSAPSMPAAEFDEILRSASVIVGHAGIGTVLMAQKLEKPIVVMPRRAAHGEHRNDHQLATVAQLQGRANVFVAADAAALEPAIREALATPYAAVTAPAGRTKLKSAIDEFIRARG